MGHLSKANSSTSPAEAGAPAYQKLLFSGRGVQGSQLSEFQLKEEVFSEG